jgi:hypothetical protein
MSKQHTIKIELTDYEAELLILAAKRCAIDMEVRIDGHPEASIKAELKDDAKMLREIMRDLNAERELLATSDKSIN